MTPLLSFQRRERTDQGKYEWVTENLGRVMDDGSVVLPAGFTTKVCIILKENGFNYTLKDLREEGLPPPRFDLIHGLRLDQEEVLVAIASHDGGIIDAPTAYGKSFVIVQICRMYPSVKIIVSAKGKSVVEELYRRLQKSFPSTEIALLTGDCHSLARITVASSDSLGKADLDGCRLYIHDEAHDAAAIKLSQRLAGILHARKFGFTASPKGRSDGSDILIEAIFGPVIHKVTYQEAQEAGHIAQLDVFMYEVIGNEIPFKQQTAVMRHGIWRNATRNLTIAQVALSIPEDEQVLIVVKTLEHAFTLKKLLPTFTIACDKMSKKKHLDARQKGWITAEEFEARTYADSKRRGVMEEQFMSGELKHVIATGIWNQGVDFIYLKYLIRGDGMAGDIPSTQIPGRLSRLPQDSDKSRGVLIDFMDLFDERFKRRAYKRRRLYRSKGWNIKVEKLQNSTGDTTS